MSLFHLEAYSPRLLKSPVDWWLLMGLISLAPLLYLQGRFLADRPHFQFFPGAICFFLVIAYQRAQPARVTHPWRLRAGYSLAASAILIAFLGGLVFSPWLAQVSAIALCFSWLLLRLGGNPWHQSVAWISVLAITVPPPLQMGEVLIRRLQSISTSAASKLLDFARVPHLATGNVLEIRTGRLFVDEACSGIDSLYALAALALAILVWQQRGFIATLLLLMSVPVWAGFGNLMRIFVIAILLDRFQIDLAHGFAHSCLGLIMFGLASVGLLATQNSIQNLLAPFAFKPQGAGSLLSLYNRLVCWPLAEPTKITTPNDQRERIATIPFQKSLELPVSCISILLIAGATLTAFQLRYQSKNAEVFVLTSKISSSAVDQQFSDESMPAELMGMRRSGFRTEHRELGSTYGPHSATWTYNDQGQPIVISVDFPFIDVHKLSLCYELSGNTIERPIAENIDNLANGSPLTIYEMRLRDQGGNESYVWYAMIKKTGDSPISAANNNGYTLRRGILSENRITPSELTVQFQIYVEGSGPLGDESINRYKQILKSMIQELVPRVHPLVWPEA